MSYRSLFYDLTKIVQSYYLYHHLSSGEYGEFIILNIIYVDQS